MGASCNVPTRGEPKLDDTVFANDNVPLAMAYVPIQRWRQLYDAEVGIERGTIFKELDKPFIGEEAVK